MPITWAGPLPRTLCAIGERHRNIEQDGWRLIRRAMPLTRRSKAT